MMKLSWFFILMLVWGLASWSCNDTKQVARIELTPLSVSIEKTSPIVGPDEAQIRIQGYQNKQKIECRFPEYLEASQTVINVHNMLRKKIKKELLTITGYFDKNKSVFFMTEIEDYDIHIYFHESEQGLDMDRAKLVVHY